MVLDAKMRPNLCGYLPYVLIKSRMGFMKTGYLCIQLRNFKSLTLPGACYISFPYPTSEKSIRLGVRCDVIDLCPILLKPWQPSDLVFTFTDGSWNISELLHHDASRSTMRCNSCMPNLLKPWIIAQYQALSSRSKLEIEHSKLLHHR